MVAEQLGGEHLDLPRDRWLPSTTAELSSKEFLAEAPEYFGGQKINEVLAAAADDVVEGWSYLPYQVYANSIFATPSASRTRTAPT